MHYGPDGVFPYAPGQLRADRLSDSVAKLSDGPRVIATFAFVGAPGAALKLAEAVAEAPALLAAIRGLYAGDPGAPDKLFRSFAKVAGLPVEVAGLTAEERAELAKFSGNPAWHLDAGQFVHPDGSEARAG